MEKRQLGSWIDAFVKYTKETEPPETFREWVAIGVVAACLQRKCYLTWGRTYYPNFFSILVSPAGKARKSTAMDYGRDFLDELGVKLSAESTTREALIRDINESRFTETDGMNVTMHSSLTIFSNEMTVFLGFRNQQLISDLCDWYDCRKRWYYKTKDKKKEDQIDNLWVNMIAATTPETLQVALPPEVIGGGLTSRMIFIYEHKKGKSVIIPPNINVSLLPSEYEPKLGKQIDELRELLSNDLYQILAMKGEFRVDESFLDTWIPFKTNHEANPLFQNTPLASYNERRQEKIIKLSMVMSAVRGNDRVMTGADLQRSIESLERVEKNMLHVFAGVGRNDNTAIMSKMISILASQKEIMQSKLMEIFYYDTDLDGLRLAIATLRTMGRLTYKPDGQGDAVITYIKKEIS